MLQELMNLRDIISSSLAVLNVGRPSQTAEQIASEGYCNKHFTGLDTLPKVSHSVTPPYCGRNSDSATERERETKPILNKMTRINSGQYCETGSSQTGE
jgi:hypothetical protein